MIRFDQLKIKYKKSQALSTIRRHIGKKLRIDVEDIHHIEILRQSIDARRNDIYFVYSVAFCCRNEKQILKKYPLLIKKMVKTEYKYPQMGNCTLPSRPVIIGAGPAGLFCALWLAEKGYAPIVYERGSSMSERVKDVDLFLKQRVLNEESNIQFGEGGAGTFSDGKLTARTKDERANKVLRTFIKYGAEPSIAYEAHPHIGTDVLRKVIVQMRKAIIDLGGDIHFHAKLDSIYVEDHAVKSIFINGKQQTCAVLVLALGNSARETFKMLQKKGVCMESKPFAVGLRIEHPQIDINKALYHDAFLHPHLEAASYRLTHKAEQRGVYTFCMCPGGEVVAATSKKQHLVVNGMSYHARDKENANSAILVQVNHHDYGNGVFDGMQFQEDLEKAMFVLGGSNYTAPVQLVKDFLDNVESMKAASVAPSYALGVKYVNLRKALPESIGDYLEQGLRAFAKMNAAFKNEEAVLTGIETRSSSPIRLLREDNMESHSVQRVFPIGEGSGYAGGIISSALDGIRCAENIMKIYKNK
ncbi:MAG: NAD(P)/FAD-dependent oxidoreductase [Breznakia sp.]